MLAALSRYPDQKVKRSKHSTLRYTMKDDNLFIPLSVNGKPAHWMVHTDNGNGTQLWTRFADEYSALIKEKSSKGTQKVLQIGGSKDRETAALPEVRFRVGGFDTILKPAEIFSKPVGNDFYHGLLGMDLLSQAARITLDFRTMTLSLQ